MLDFQMKLKLLRNVYDDSHDSEVALDSKNYDHSKFWKVLDNRKIDIGETITRVKSLLEKI